MVEKKKKQVTHDISPKSTAMRISVVNSSVNFQLSSGNQVRTFLKENLTTNLRFVYLRLQSRRQFFIMKNI